MKNNIVCKQVRFCQGNGASRNYYLSGRYLEYISRKEAVQTELEPGLINLNTLEAYSFDDYQELKTKFSNLNERQMIWDYVISFSNEFEIDKCLKEKEDVAKIIQEPLEDFFKKNHLNMEDFEIFGALHKNTDHLHMHVGFFEKKEIYVDKNGNEQFQKVGKLGGKDVALFKQLGADIENFVENDYFTKRLIDYRKKLESKSKNLLQKDDFSSLVSHFVDKNIHTFQFNKLDDDTKELVNKCVSYLIENNEDLKQDYDAFKKTLLELKDYHNEVNDAYKLSDKNDVNNEQWFELENKNIDFRLANILLKSIKNDVINQFDENNESEDELEDSLLKEVENVIKKNIDYKKIKKAKILRKSRKEKLMKPKPTISRKAYNPEFNSEVAKSIRKLKKQVDRTLANNVQQAENIYKRMQEERFKNEHEQQIR